MADNSFKKDFRLLSPHDFLNLKSNSKAFKKSFVAIYYKRNNLDHARIGLSVSTKVGNSVTRNIIKRMFRELFRISTMKNTPYDFLIVVFPNRKVEKIQFFESLKLSFLDFSRYISSL